MWAEFRYTLGRLRGQIIGWSIGLAAYGLLMVSFFDSIVNIEGFEDILASYPQEMMAFFGDFMAIMTPVGYLDIYYFSYMTVIVGIFAVGVCATLLVGDEEKGILDLVMAHPISRSAIFFGRWSGFVVATMIILGAGWLSWAIPVGGTGLDLSWIELLRPFIPLLVMLVLFGGLALLLSMLLPSARMASMLAGGLMVGNYLLTGLANMNEDLKAVVEYTPLHYFQGGKAVEGINGQWLSGLLLAAVVLLVLAWWRFERRDIRVGGEGGWRLSWQRKLKVNAG